MKFSFIFTGRTKIDYINSGISDYQNRLKHYVKSEIIVVPELKNTRKMNEAEIMKREEEGILKSVPDRSFLILLDENGKKFSSQSFAGYLNRKIVEGRDICMVIGGAWGFSKELKRKADQIISLSAMTFSHQMVRMILLEQVYRAFTIIRGEPYHHS